MIFCLGLKGITLLNVDPKLVSGKNFKTIFESEDADIVICRTVEELKKAYYRAKFQDTSRKY